MNATTGDNQTDHQREVQRLLGRCLIRLQQYERLLKAIVAESDLAGPLNELETIRAERFNAINTNTLGHLIRQLLSRILVPGGAENQFELVEDVSTTSVLSVKRTIRIELPAEFYDRTASELIELVRLRNELVHHFIERNDIQTQNGCQQASEALTVAYERIHQKFEELLMYARLHDHAASGFAEIVKSDGFRDYMILGITPDGKILWPCSGIVRALREASTELAVDGWTSACLAGKWISARYPELQPARYNCSSWRQVIHESRLFDLRYLCIEGTRQACYRDLLKG